MADCDSLSDDVSDLRSDLERLENIMSWFMVQWARALLGRHVQIDDWDDIPSDTIPLEFYRATFLLVDATAEHKKYGGKKPVAHIKYLGQTFQVPVYALKFI